MSGFDDLRVRIQADIFAGVPAHFSRLGWSEGQLRGWQRDRLRALLATASRRSAFHRRRLAGIDPARFELAGLPSLPVMTKAELMADFDAVSCDPRLIREAAEQALSATGSEPRPLPGGYLCMATGGSSGQRGIFAYDQAGAAEFATLIFRTRLAALGADPARVPEISFAMVAAPRPRCTARCSSRACWQAARSGSRSSLSPGRSPTSSAVSTNCGLTGCSATRACSPGWPSSSARAGCRSRRGW
jgi:phenylacetate-CoA ligase